MSKWFQIKYGTSRTVVLIPFLSIALKFPVIHMRKCIRSTWSFCRKKTSLRWMWEHIIAAPVDRPFSIGYFLLKGFVVNWREYRFYRETQNPFLWPTHFSFFGMVNIQRIAQKCDCTPLEVWNRLIRVAGEDVHEDSHTFFSEGNFCNDGGKLRILDYGSKEAQKVIANYGQKFAALSGSLE